MKQLVCLVALCGFGLSATANVRDLLKVDSVSAGGEHTCVTDARGLVRCWGCGQYGRLGSGTQDSLGTSPGEEAPNLPYVEF